MVKDWDRSVKAFLHNNFSKFRILWKNRFFSHFSVRIRWWIEKWNPGSIVFSRANSCEFWSISYGIVEWLSASWLLSGWWLTLKVASSFSYQILFFPPRSNFLCTYIWFHLFENDKNHTMSPEIHFEDKNRLFQSMLQRSKAWSLLPSWRFYIFIYAFRTNTILSGWSIIILINRFPRHFGVRTM